MSKRYLFFEYILSFALAVGIFMLLKSGGVSGVAFSTATATSYSVIFLIGLVAASSSCISVAGGVLLGITARYSQTHHAETRFQKALPHLLFNAGRITGYTVFGGLLGLLGSYVALSPRATGIITLIAAVAMILMGLKILNILGHFVMPSLLPHWVSRRVVALENSKRPWSIFAAGALTFFLPCGFTQALQLYAISSGSVIRGALSLGVFSLGTLPALLSLGLIAGFAKGRFQQVFFKVSGVLVIFLGVSALSSGWALTGFSEIVQGAPVQPVAIERVGESDVQVVRMSVNERGYSPDSFTIKKDIPVRWEIQGQKFPGCQSFLIVPKLKISKFLEPGMNVVSFMPEDEGTLPFMCSMGMYRGAFTVLP